MELYKQINIDLYNPYPLCIMNAKQGDTARGAIVTLAAGGSIIEPTTEQVRIYAKKQDGTKIYNDCTIQEGRVKVKFTNQFLSVPGHLPVEIEIVSGDEILSTPIFIIQVLPSNIDSQAIESSNEFTALQAALAEANSYKEEYQKKPDAILNIEQESTDFNVGHLEFEEKPFYPEIPVKQIRNFSYGTVDFETAAEREEISTGETLSSLFGKLKKWFSDLAAGAASTLLGENLIIDRALISDTSGKVAASDVSSTELGYLKNASSNIQEQIGAITGLKTEEKGSLVEALNEINSNMEYQVGDTYRFSGIIPMITNASGSILVGSLSIPKEVASNVSGCSVLSWSVQWLRAGGTNYGTSSLTGLTADIPLSDGVLGLTFNSSLSAIKEYYVSVNFTIQFT